MHGNRLRAPEGAGTRRRLARGLAALGAAVVLLGGVAREAHAIGERISDIRVMGNQRTSEDAIRSMAGIDIGDTMETDTLATVRERLNNAGLFSDVNVWWEPHTDGVRVNIAVKDKFPWAPVPTASWSSNNKSFGLVFVHGNLFGRGKQFVIGARLATVDSGAILAYRDPSLFGTWLYWEMLAIAQRQIIPEFDQHDPAPDNPWRETTVDAFGLQPTFGIAWFRRVRTEVSWRIDKVNVPTDRTKVYDPATGVQIMQTDPLDPAFHTSRSGTMGIGRALLAFDWRTREFAVMSGAALGGQIELGSSAFGSDFEFWRASAFWEHGIRILKRLNLIYSAGATAAHNTPIWWDTTAGGSSLRGYLFQQYRGDTQLNARVEFHFPIVSISSLDIRGLTFYDASAIWYRTLPDAPADGSSVYAVREADGRSFNTLYSVKGFDAKRDVHDDVGAGIRFFLRSVAIPLVGLDFGFNLESKIWRYLIVIGA